VTERAEHFEHLAPGGEGTAIGPLVLIHRLHEDDFFFGVVLLAGGGIDLPAAFPLLPAVLPGAAFHGHGNVAFAPVVVRPPLPSPTIGDGNFRGFFAAHGYLCSDQG